MPVEQTPMQGVFTGLKAAEVTAEFYGITQVNARYKGLIYLS